MKQTKQNWIIKDWAGNECFNRREFKDFDAAEAFLSRKLKSDYETDRGEYEIQEVPDEQD